MIALAPSVSPEEALAGAEVIYREQAAELDRLRGQIVVLRARLGEEEADGLMSFARIRALEDASDAARTHLLGGPVSHQEALAACELARRTL